VVGSDDETTPAGWYRQKDDPSLLRWWDGEDWTDETMPVPDGLEKARRNDAPALADRPAPSSRPLELSAMPGRAAAATPRPTAPAATSAPRIRIGDDGDDWVAGAWAADDVAPPARARSGAPARPRPRPRPGADRPTEPAPGARTRSHRTAPTPRREETPLIADRPSVGGRSRDGDGGAHVVRQDSGSGARAAIVALVAALLLAGGWFAYTNLRDAAPDRAETVPTEVPKVDKRDAGLRPLDQVALAARDLPSGWRKADKADPDATAICYGRSPASVLTPSDGKVVSFSQGASGPFLNNVVEQFANVEVAEEFMDLTAKTVNTCRSYEANDSTIHLGPVDFPKFGDETFAARVTGTSKYGAIEGRLVYVRKGARVTSLSTISFGGPGVSNELVLFLTRGLAARL
jgi:hypothetical protein